MKNKLLLLSFISVVAVASVNFLANALYLYWTIWWFDNVVHFLGGLSMGLFSFWIFKKFYDFNRAPGLRKVAFIVFLSVITIGIGWEVFEYIFNIAILSPRETYWQDTSYDLISDTIGALIASFIIYKNRLHV